MNQIKRIDWGSSTQSIIREVVSKLSFKSAKPLRSKFTRFGVTKISHYLLKLMCFFPDLDTKRTGQESQVSMLLNFFARHQLQRNISLTVSPWKIFLSKSTLGSKTRAYFVKYHTVAFGYGRLMILNSQSSVSYL